MPSVVAFFDHPSINWSMVNPPRMKLVAVLMTTFGCALIDGGGECSLYAYMPTSRPEYFACTAAATSLASVSARSLTLPSFLHSAHSHHPPPSLGSTETESRVGSLSNCATASAATSFRSSGLEMQNFVDFRS